MENVPGTSGSVFVAHSQYDTEMQAIIELQKIIETNTHQFVIVQLKLLWTPPESDN